MVDFVVSLSNGRPDSNATWIQEDDLRHLDSSLLDCYLSFHSSESSSFQPGRNDGAWSRPLYGPINYLFNFIYGFIRYDFCLCL